MSILRQNTGFYTSVNKSGLAHFQDWRSMKEKSIDHVENENKSIAVIVQR